MRYRLEEDRGISGDGDKVAGSRRAVCGEKRVSIVSDRLKLCMFSLYSL